MKVTIKMAPTMISDLAMKLTFMGDALSGPIAKEIITEGIAAVRDVAAEMCPYDDTDDGYGHLQDAIDFEVRSGSQGVGRGNGYYGRVFIRKNAHTGKYALQIHEGDYKLGEGSKAKQKMTKYRVGNKFIQRALDGNRADLGRIIEMKLKIAIEAMARRSGSNIVPKSQPIARKATPAPTIMSKTERLQWMKDKYSAGE